MPDQVVGQTLTRAEMQADMKAWAQDLMAEWRKEPVKVAAAQEPVKVEAKIDGSSVTGSLVKAEAKADMRAMGIAGLVESGDRFKILQFELGPITSALVGIPTGIVASKAISAWIPPYRDAAGAPTATRPATVGFGQINLLNPVAHVGGMVLAETYGHQILGRTAAHFIAGGLFISALLTYTPLGSWLDNLVTAISPKTTTAAQNRSGNAAQRQRVMQQPAASNGARNLSWA